MKIVKAIAKPISIADNAQEPTAGANASTISRKYPTTSGGAEQVT